MSSNRERRVVLVAPEFPPLNSAGAHRPRLFARHLPAFGWTPVVLTIRRDLIEGPLDIRLEGLLAPELQVIRTAALPTRPVRLIGDLGMRSLMSHAWQLTRLAREQRAQTVVLFGPPWFSFSLGPLLRRWLGIPYVMDYIDPWTSAAPTPRAFPSKAWFHDRAAAVIEPAALRSAAHVTAVSQSILRELQARYPWLADDRLTAMPYGAEPEDLEASRRLGVRPPDFSAGDGHVTLVFTGAVQPTAAPLVAAVLRGLRRLRDSRSELGRRLRLRCYGTSNLNWGHGRHAVVPLARELGVGEMVSETPERIPYLEAMAVLRECHLVLVMGSTDAYYHASKLYPAMVSGKPILALCHAASSIVDVMKRAGAGITIGFNRVEDLEGREAEIACALERLAVQPDRPVNSAAVDDFTARHSTAVLAGVLDRVTLQPLLAEAI
jgi:hypothetical protein